jgi:serine/threonine-protein kinase
MSTAGPVSELLLRWEEGRALGRPVSAEELCRERPELLEEVRRAVGALEAVYGVPTCVGEPPAAGSEPAAAPPGYELLGELGRGGMGVVYRARQVGLNRLVALKMILSGGHAGPRERARFKAEAEAVARLSHPNIVSVYEVGEHQGRPFLALELVAGGSLAQHLQGKPLQARRAAELVAALARGARAAHEAGVVHRDLKPANVLMGVSVGAAPKIADFGLAKRLDEPGATRTGDVMGTPSYMAPEQAAGRWREVGPHTDVYALGAILYECLTGRPPFLGATVIETIDQVLTQAPAPPSLLLPKVPRELEVICLKCLHKEPAGRYASAQALADDLERFLAGEPIQARASGMFEQLVRALRHSQYDVRLRGWGTLLLCLAPLPTLGQLPAAVLALAGRPLPVAVVGSGLAGAGSILLGLWLGRPRRDSSGPAERQVWSILIGQLLALSVMALVSWPLDDPQALYPRWAVLTGLAFFIMGGSYWGGCYLMGLSFFALAALMRLCPPASPLALGALLSGAIILLGLRLRRLGRELAEGGRDA